MSAGAALERHQNRWLDIQYKSYSSGYREFLVTCTLAGDGPAAALTASGLPTLGAYYPNRTDVFLQSIKAVPYESESDMFHFLVQCTYGYTVFADPTSLAATFSYGAVAEEFFPDEDLSVPPLPLLNTAGDRFDPAISVKEYHPVITVKKNVSVAGFDPSWAHLIGKVNSSSMTIDAVTCPAYSVLLQDFQAEKTQWQNGSAITSYYQCTCSFELNPKLWIPRKMRSSGFNQKIAGKPALIEVYPGRETSEPMMLNSLGVKTLVVSESYIHEFVLYAAVDLSVLPGV